MQQTHIFFPKLPSDLIKLEILVRAADLSMLESATSIFIDLVQKSEGFLPATIQNHVIMSAT